MSCHKLRLFTYIMVIYYYFRNKIQYHIDIFAINRDIRYGWRRRNQPIHFLPTFFNTNMRSVSLADCYCLNAHLELFIFRILTRTRNKTIQQHKTAIHEPPGSEPSLWRVDTWDVVGGMEPSTQRMWWRQQLEEMKDRWNFLDIFL